MTKYLIAVLGFIVALLLLLFWVGGDVFLTLKSSATSGILAFGEISFSWQAVIVAGVFGTLGLIGLWSLFLWLWRLPRRVKSGVGLRRRNRALDAMEEALLAGAEGDVKKARKKAEVARNLIGSTELGRVISALSAEAAGDSDVAVEHYQAMLESEKTRATGQRGLAQNMLATGDLPGAIE
ncbi:MAG: heme biosynthesis HemY N-terminal domain-containing protein, partial [Sneathiella sp.]